MVNDRRYSKELRLKMIDASGVEIELLDDLTSFQVHGFKGSRHFELGGRTPKLLNWPVKTGANLLQTTSGIVATARTARIFEKFAANDVQLVRLSYRGKTNRFFIVNPTMARDCIVTNLMQYKIGREKRSVRRLVIDRTKAGDADLFRILDPIHAVIVSDRLKDALVRQGAAGQLFLPVAIYHDEGNSRRVPRSSRHARAPRIPSGS